MGLVQRVLRAPLAAHAAVLALVLLLVVPIVGTTGQFTSDEGAALAQAVRLERGDGWTMPNSFPAADPEGSAFPIDLSERSGDAYAPFAKHPVYPVLLAATYRVGGRAALIMLSIVGTLAAALLSALLARRVDPALAVPALWTVGIASPLFLDSYIVVAHTLGAACAAGAALLLLRRLEERRSWIAVAGAAVLLLVGMLLRTEMLFMGLGLAITLAIAGARRKSLGTVALAAVPAAAVVAGVALDRLLVRLVMGGASATTTTVAGQSAGLAAGRITAFKNSWLLPAFGADRRAVLVLLVAVTAVVAVVLARRTPPERDGVRLFAVIAAVAAVARVLLGGSTVPGLLVAFPLALAGLAALRRETFAGAPARFLGATFGFFAAGVLATQYSDGGGAQWGGRYFAVGLPLIVPVLLLALRDVGRRLDRRTASIALASAVVVSIASCALAVITVREEHQAVDRVVAAVDQAAQRNPADDGGLPVVLTSNPGLGRFAFSVLDRYRWLTVPADRLPEYAQRLHDLGVGPVTFVSRNASEDLAKIDDLYTARDKTEPAAGWTIATLEPCTQPNGCSPTG